MFSTVSAGNPTERPLLEISPLTWGVTIGFIVLLLAVDLVLAAARPHHVGFKEATAWSVFYIAVAIGFGVWFGLQYGNTAGTEYFAGYIIEKSLSVDNLFVFVIIMSTFAVPDKHQHKVLVFGIVLALIMRAIFIALGASLISLFSFTFLFFGLLLIYTAVQLFRHRNEDPDIESNLMVRGARRFLPVSDDYIGESIPEIPTPLSLAVVLGVLAVVTVASLIRTRGLPDEKAHAGSLTATKVRVDVKPKGRPDREPPR
jgi:TerC family integral membrane protein